MRACAVFGHRFTFRADGDVMRWDCDRGCSAGGSKHYASAAEAQRYAAGLNRRDNDKVGKRAPLFGLLPLRIFRRLADQKPKGG
jgi:hypothetical protein